MWYSEMLIQLLIEMDETQIEKKMGGRYTMT